MSSYNNIEKIKYASDDCVVTLDEYIVFENERAEKKYVVFKFSNNVNQQLLGMEFEVSQYDIDNNLIEKSVVIYNKFLAKPVQSFVPNAKLNVNYACKTLSVRLIQAAFDRFIWKEGQFLDNSYKFEHYAEDEDKAAAKKASSAPPVYIFPPNPALAPARRKGELPFTAKNTTRKNLAKFPAVFNTIACLLAVGAIIFAVFHFANNTDEFSVDNFDFKIIDSKAQTVSVIGYSGKEKDVVIPATVNEYTVLRIGKEAFQNSDIESVYFNSTMLYIDEYAFNGCTKLEEVESEASIIVHSYAFNNCTALKTVFLPYASLLKNSFNGCTSVNYIKYGSIGTNTIDDVFGGNAPAGLIS
ncbi:MAG: leucine-rich repeat domain-containing protein [Clostridia bacterium]|nr:leucine-rich repeat domain-containing protein [Clostridia bacterium]